MGGMWKLEGRELGNSTTEVLIMGSVRNVEVRTPTEAIYGGTEVVERVGKGLNRLNLTFTILGQDTAKHAWVAYIMGILENREHIRLESPSDEEDYRLLDESRVISFTPEGRVSVTQVNRAQYDLVIPIIVHGTPMSDGGSFESCTPYTVEFLDNDFWAATNSAGYTDAPLLGLPEQETGWPKAVNATTFAKESIPAASRDGILIASDGAGGQSLVELWSLAGYVFGTPHAEGTGGPAEVCENPEGSPATGEAYYANVATLANDFSITSASAPALVGGGPFRRLVYPIATAAETSWTIVASDGAGGTATVTIGRATTPDGVGIIQEET